MGNDRQAEDLRIRCPEDAGDLGFLGKLFGAKKPEEAALGKLREALAKAGKGAFRIYRTAGGFRAMATDRAFDPAGAEAKQLMEATGTDPWFVLTGDTLFVGAVGRPDLPGRARENAGDLYDSIHDKLLTLPDDLEIFPGHFAGSACGAGMSGKPSSTIAFEKRWNTLLSKTREEFVDALADVPPKPAAMEQILRINQGREEIK